MVMTAKLPIVIVVVVVAVLVVVLAASCVQAKVLITRLT